MQQNTPNPPSAEEIAKMKEEMTKFYEEKIPFLKLHEEHDRLMADIAEHKVRRISAEHHYAQFVLEQKKLQEESKKQETKESNGEVSAK